MNSKQERDASKQLKEGILKIRVIELERAWGTTRGEWGWDDLASEEGIVFLRREDGAWTGHLDRWSEDGWVFDQPDDHWAFDEPFEEGVIIEVAVWLDANP